LAGERLVVGRVTPCDSTILPALLVRMIKQESDKVERVQSPVRHHAAEDIGSKWLADTGCQGHAVVKIR